jgi:hypothetical protein
MKPFEWKNRLAESGWRCFWCGKPVIDTDEPEGENKAVPDHFIPISKGGPDVVENVNVSCQPCNRIRGNKSFEEFMRDRWILAQYQAQKPTGISLFKQRNGEQYGCLKKLAEQKKMDASEPPKKSAEAWRENLRQSGYLKERRRG